VELDGHHMLSCVPAAIETFSKIQTSYLNNAFLRKTLLSIPL